MFDSDQITMHTSRTDCERLNSEEIEKPQFYDEDNDDKNEAFIKCVFVFCDVRVCVCVGVATVLNSESPSEKIES